MRRVYFLLSFTVFFTILFSSTYINAQDDDYDKDYDLASEYYKKGLNFRNQNKLDSADVNFKKATVLFKKHEEWENYFTIKNEIGKIMLTKRQYDSAISLFTENINQSKEKLEENNEYLANFQDNLGLTLFFQGKYDDALTYHDKALAVRIVLGQKNNIFTSNIYNNIGNVYTAKGEFDIALDYYQKSLKIRKAILGNNHPETATSYNNIGLIYKEQREYDKAIEYHKKAISIQKAIFGENFPELATGYQGIGTVYKTKGELDLAMEYFMKALSIRKKRFGDNHPLVAKDLINIGNVYIDKNDNDNAVDVFQKALRIQLKTLSKTHPDLAITYNNIGNIYSNNEEFDLALSFYLKAVDIKKANVGEEHPEIADFYNNIGNIYLEKGDYEQALSYQEQALMLKELFFGPTHPATTLQYLNIGNIYYKQSEYDKALDNFQKSIVANVKNFKITEGDVVKNPEIKNYYDIVKLLGSLRGKAKSFAGKYTKNELTQELEYAFNTYKKIDKIIDVIRRTTTSKKDKIEFGKVSSAIYDQAVDVCFKLNKLKNKEKGQFYLEEAFYFSEKNKAGVLLEAIAGSDAKKFAGIPDNALKKEKDLNNKIANLEKKLAEEYDPDKAAAIQNKMFNFKREYNNLVVGFEKKYPKYYEMKYANKYVNISQIQSILDNQTAIRSYLLGDSLIYIFTISKDEIFLDKSIKTDEFDFQIFAIRKQMTSGSIADIKQFMIDANTLHTTLFPKPLVENIKRLIIIPDGNLGLIPFEALLTKKADYKFNEFSKYPFLIKDYEISYQYSANLYYKIYNKILESEKLWTSESWLGVAPVFKDTKNLVINDANITALPGSETEINTIKTNFTKKGYKADSKLFVEANETFMKSTALKNYKYLHIATHGFVNSDKPELSGIIMTDKHDKTSDGVLYSGEIYNLNLNSDLVVLSACETGLGKVSEGEGIIGLSRALLYAGTNNIVVSLWKVADNSTSQLMVDLYSNMIKGFKNKNKTFLYSNSLREAKLKMINNEKFGHPFFWSPFILIGK